MPKYIAMGLSLPPDLRAKLEAEPDKTAVAKPAVVKPAVPQRIAMGIPKEPRIPLDTEKPLFPNNAPVMEELLRRYLKKKNLYSDFVKPGYNLRGITPWDIIELQLRARESGLNPTEEELSI